MCTVDRIGRGGHIPEPKRCRPDAAAQTETGALPTASTRPAVDPGLDPGSRRVQCPRADARTRTGDPFITRRSLAVEFGLVEPDYLILARAGKVLICGIGDTFRDTRFPKSRAGLRELSRGCRYSPSAFTLRRLTPFRLAPRPAAQKPRTRARARARARASRARGDALRRLVERVLRPNRGARGRPTAACR